ncbi:cytochrome c oxidase assembly factor Coa1 family protein [Pseudomonas sp. CGJS7]|uniref:cytochrome c oxidase assembly factor Coa1 family protein n=1 Tax=Pseudomonas sp. CGJS7 TaxID=3109348 RepID=UPI00300B8943
MNTPYRKPWVHRHWLLVLVLSLVTMVVLSLGIGAGVMYTLMSAMKNTAPYREAMARVRADARMTDSLGQPIESRWVPLGGAEQREGGVATMVVFLQGPRGRGSVDIVAKFENGAWHYHKVDAVSDGPPRQEFDLLHESER